MRFFRPLLSPWFAAFFPGIVILVMLVPLLVPLPYLDGWSFVQQYQRWIEGGYSWNEFFEPHYVHQSAVGKIVYFAVLHWCGGNMTLLPLLMWAMAAVIMGCVCHLSRPLWKDRPAWGAVAMFLVGLTVFNAAQGEVWIWGFLFQNSVPGMCLAIGLVVLHGQPLGVWRLLVAALMVVIATFSFGSGPLVGLLLSMLIWHGMAGKSVARRCVAVGVWLAFTGIAAWLALRLIPDDAQGTDLGIVFDRPLMRVQFTLILLAQMLGKGTVFEPHVLCALFGGILLIVFLACTGYVLRRRRDRELVTAALPWIAFSLFGLGTAMAICVGRSFNSLANSLEERYAALTLFFIFGTMLLAAVVVRHGAASHAWIRGMRLAAKPALVVLFLALAVNWERGRHGMELKHVSMEQERAMLAFVHVLPPDPAWMKSRLTRQSAFKMSKYLASKNRLQGVIFAPDTRAASFSRGTDAPKQWARFDEPQVLQDGRWLLRGIGGTSAENVSDLVLITAQSADANEEEKIIALTAPLAPDTIFERQAQARKHPEHYLGWKHILESGSIPPGRLTLRAYIYEQDKQRLRPISGAYLMGTSLKQSSLTTKD